MADIEAIRRGLAANLRDCLPANEGQVSPYLLESPLPKALQVAGFDRIEYQRTFGDDSTLFMVIEGAASLAATSDGAQRVFDQWLWSTGSDSVKAALEADSQLTSRLRDNGTVLTGQPAACEALAVIEFRGYRRGRVKDGAEALLGDWLVQIETGG